MSIKRHTPIIPGSPLFAADIRTHEPHQLASGIGLIKIIEGNLAGWTLVHSRRWCEILDYFLRSCVRQAAAIISGGTVGVDKS